MYTTIMTELLPAPNLNLTWPPNNLQLVVDKKIEGAVLICDSFET